MKAARPFLAVALVLAVFAAGMELATRDNLHDGVSYSSAFFDRRGKLLRLELSTDQKYRLWTPLRDLSPRMIEATLLLEDRYFYWHAGVNPIALTRAVWQSFVTKEAKLGASTITMQLARLRYKLKTRTVAGKLKQIGYALALEWHHSKDEILEAYLNLAPYGGNVEGAGAASEIYFQKRPKDLTVGEALMLAVLPQSPTSRAPNAEPQPGGVPKGLETARDRLLASWLERHPDQEKDLQSLTFQRVVRRPSELPFRAPHFVDALGHGAPAGAVPTTVDLKLQSLLELKLRNYVEAKRNVGIKNGSALLLDYRTMEILALVGSVDFRSPAIQGQVDGTRGKRSPGSTLKPFIYALAMDQGLIHPRTLLKDAPTAFGEWRPENFDQDFAGPVNAHDALIRSRNVPAVHLAGLLKDPSFYEFLRAGRVTGLKDESFYGLALALGGAETTMQELARLYAMLGNGGMLKSLRRRASDPHDAGVRLLSPEAAELVLEILRDNPRPRQGFERHWVRNPVAVAWKTGTSYSFRDAWSVGVVGPYVLAVWIGNFDGESNPAFVGLEAAAPLFFEMVDALAAEGLPPVPVASLSGVKEVEVCALSGKIPGPHCRHKVKTGFIPGKSPIESCDIHRALAIDLESGLRSCPLLGRPTRDEVFEFWDSDILRLFRLAGMPRRLPPKWHPACGVKEKSYVGRAPRITSPRADVTYNVRLSERRPDKVPFLATTDADASKIYWFLDNAFVGIGEAGQPFFWEPKPGDFQIRAVDNLGRAAQAKLKVALVE